MGVELWGVLFKGPRRLTITDDQRAFALSRAQEVLDFLPTWQAIEDGDVECTIDIDLTKFPQFGDDPWNDFLRFDCSVVDEYPPDVWLDLLVYLWEGEHDISDVTWKIDPDNPDQAYGFAGETTHRSEATGTAYTILKAAYILGFWQICGIR